MNDFDFVEDESDEVSPLNLGMIAAYYNISCECSTYFKRQL